jgi:ubiquinone/menaquinone biosynthesis C-methylase UbiE
MQISPENKSPQVQRFLRKEVSDFHAHLVGLLNVQPNDRVLDLGCGRGATLVHLADTISNEGKLVGLDFDQPSLDECGQIFHGIPFDLIQHDLNRSLPFGDGEFTKIVCHNVLECLHDKEAFLNECARVLVPGGVLVLSHSDFDTIVFNSSFTELTRKLVHTFADATQPWMDTSDAMMGRKLAGIVQESSFSKQRVEGYSVISTELAEFSPGGAFMNDILGAAREANAFDQNELEGWEKEQRQFNEQGKFLYAVTNFIVVAVK